VDYPRHRRIANQVSYRTILDETEAIETALDEAPDGSLVVILAGKCDPVY
jgi:UDP-N-acetylmuramyl tripeptide synthase